jgi:hypothetical protein
LIEAAIQTRPANCGEHLDAGKRKHQPAQIMGRADLSKSVWG